MYFFKEISQDEIKDHNSQEDKQNDASLANELASQQGGEPEDDLPLTDDDSMADQADEPDSDDEDNALEQQDDDDQLSAQGKTSSLTTNNYESLYMQVEKDVAI